MTATEQRNLADALQDEIRRVRDEVLPEYVKLQGTPGVNVNWAIANMRAELDRATKALAEHDGVECMRAYEALKGCTL